MSSETEETAALFHNEQRNDSLIAALEDLPIFLNSSESTLEERLIRYIAHVCATLKNIDCQKVGFRLEDSFKALMTYEDYYNSVIPKREHLVALGGYVAHVCRCVTDDNIFEKIHTEIFAAVDYEICKPIHKEVNAMWQEWNFPKTGEYNNVKTWGDMIDICIKRIEEFYPDYLKIFVKWFELDMEELV